MTCVIFENPGEIDMVAVSTFGVSVKETDNPIGFFGTGLKYALAILLRTGHQVWLQIGENAYQFRAIATTVRGKEFYIVHAFGLDSESIHLGFTTDVGKTWDLWMAYRELWANCKDENGSTYIADETPKPQADTTRLIVRGEQFLEAHNNRSSFILHGRAPITTLGDGAEVYDGESTAIFYKGFKVYELPDGMHSRFTWNLTTQIDLTEDRTAKYPIMLPRHISGALLGCKSEEFIRECIALDKEWWEHKLDFSYMGSFYTSPGPTFVEAVDNIAQHKMAQINPTAMTVYKEVKHKHIEPAKTELNSIEAETLSRAARFLRDVLHVPVDDYLLCVTDSLGTNVMGLAKNQTIYVSRRAFDQGTKRVAATLYEEFVHLRHGYHDETRAFEDFLIDRIMSLGEELRGEPL